MVPIPEFLSRTNPGVCVPSSDTKATSTWKTPTSKLVVAAAAVGVVGRRRCRGRNSNAATCQPFHPMEMVRQDAVS